jgi:hypothetical protein
MNWKWKKVVVALIKIQSPAEEAEESHETPQSGELVPRPRVEQSTF